MNSYSTEDCQKSQEKCVADLRLWLVALIVGTGIWLVGSQPAHAAVYQPEELLPGETYQLLFVTNGTIDAVSGDVAVYNLFAQQQAAMNSSVTGTDDGVTYSAVVSTSGGAIAKVNALVETKVYNTAGDLLAIDFADMWDSTLLHPVRFDQFKTQSGSAVWTGTAGDGTPDPFLPIGSLSDESLLGAPNVTDFQWVNLLGAPTSHQAPLYALSSLITVPPIPEPSAITLSLLSILTFGLRGSRYRKRG